MISKAQLKREGWRAVASFKFADKERIDLWMHIYASPKSMGMSDEFEVTDCWRENGKWYHIYRSKSAELDSWYVTHWRPISERVEPPLHDRWEA